MSLKRFYQENHVLNIVFSTFLSIKKNKWNCWQAAKGTPTTISEKWAQYHSNGNWMANMVNNTAAIPVQKASRGLCLLQLTWARLCVGHSHVYYSTAQDGETP